MVVNVKSMTYDPKEYIKDKVVSILPDDCDFKKVEFSGYIKRAFHSNDRPNGIITVRYSEKSAEKYLQLFVKQHHNAEKVYNHMLSVYNGLKLVQMESHMPRPLFCDRNHNVIFMEYFPGKNMTFEVLTELLLQRRKNLEKLFKSIGQWLSAYHSFTKLEKTITIQEIKDKIHENLNDTLYFSTSEKNSISRRLNNLAFNNTYLLMIKPHNDFALRNIIHTPESNFVVIDWDAIFHSKFKPESSVWNDITSFLISLNSLKRFSPAIRNSDIDLLSDSFLSGYFEINTSSEASEIQNHLYLFTLSFYLGMIGDRSLPEIYNNKLGFRFISRIRSNLIKGSCF